MILKREKVIGHLILDPRLSISSHLDDVTLGHFSLRAAIALGRYAKVHSAHVNDRIVPVPRAKVCRTGGPSTAKDGHSAGGVKPLFVGFQTASVGKTATTLRANAPLFACCAFMTTS